MSNQKYSLKSQVNQSLRTGATGIRTPDLIHAMETENNKINGLDVVDRLKTVVFGTIRQSIVSQWVSRSSLEFTFHHQQDF